MPAFARALAFAAACPASSVESVGGWQHPPGPRLQGTQAIRSGRPATLERAAIILGQQAGAALRPSIASLALMAEFDCNGDAPSSMRPSAGVRLAFPIGPR